MYLFDCGLESEEWRKVMVIFTSIFVTFSVALYTTLTGRNKKVDCFNTNCFIFNCCIWLRNLDKFWLSRWSTR
jgi:hypothetical protein